MLNDRYIVAQSGPRQHAWRPANSDLVEWKCDYCGFVVYTSGPPIEDFRVVYNDPETGKEVPVSCEEIEAGFEQILGVHNS